jgi:hypothetical protein
MWWLVLPSTNMRLDNAMTNPSCGTLFSSLLLEKNAHRGACQTAARLGKEQGKVKAQKTRAVFVSFLEVVARKQRRRVLGLGLVAR